MAGDAGWSAGESSEVCPRWVVFDCFLPFRGWRVHGCVFSISCGFHLRSRMAVKKKRAFGISGLYQTTLRTIGEEQQETYPSYVSSKLSLLYVAISHLPLVNISVHDCFVYSL